MTIYIDSDYKCYVSEAEGRRAIETNTFNGKCAEWIESYRFVPEGETWMREDGEEFRGEMTAPWKDYSELYLAQLEYEVEQYKIAMTEIETALEVTSE